MTPSWSTYLHVVSLVLGLGSFAVAAEVYSRFLARRNGRVLDGYVVSLGLAVCAGILAMGMRPLPRATRDRAPRRGFATGVPLGCRRPLERSSDRTGGDASQGGFGPSAGLDAGNRRGTCNEGDRSARGTAAR